MPPPKQQPRPKPREIEGTAARQVRDATTYTAYGDPLEVRTIVVAHGADFHNTCKLKTYGWRIPEDLDLAADPDIRKPLSERTQQKRPLPGLTIKPDGSAECINKRQRVKYILKFVNSKDEFIKALKTPEIMVIYAGHARYGRGPCFSDPALHTTAYSYSDCPRPCENWGEGTDKTKWGLFRWGYRYIPVPASEITFYGYTANPALSTVKLRSDTLRPDRHPDIAVGVDSRGRPKLEITKLESLVQQVEDVWTDLKLDIDAHGYDQQKQQLPEDLGHLLHSKPQDLRKFLKVPPHQSFWVQRKYYHYVRWTDATKKVVAFQKWYALPMVIQVAGWDQTSVSPYDLGGTEIKCRCLCHFGCSTKKHNWPILRRQKYKGWRQKGNERYAYFTTAMAYNIVTNFFIYHVLTFNERSAGLSWRKLLDDALVKTNNDLDICNVGFHVF